MEYTRRFSEGILSFLFSDLYRVDTENIRVYTEIAEVHYTPVTLNTGNRMKRRVTRRFIGVNYICVCYTGHVQQNLFYPTFK